MKQVFLLMVMVAFPMVILGQGDLPTTKPLEIGRKNNLDALPSNQGTVLRVPSVLDDDLVSKNTPIQMLPERQLLQAGHGLKIDPKVGEREKKRNIEICHARETAVVDQRLR